MSKILIAGGTGFVGVNTARAFAEEGVSVVVTSRKRRDAIGEALSSENNRIDLEYVNLENGAEVFDLFARHSFDGVVLLAHAHQYARSRAASNTIYPMTLNCLEGARATNVKRLVFASSRAIYGGLNPPFDEDARFPTKVSYVGTQQEKLGLPRFPEFETVIKRTIEMICFDYSIPMPASTSGLAGAATNRTIDVVALRFPIQWGQGYSAMGNPFSLAAHAAVGKIESLEGRTGYLGLPVVDFWNLMSGASTCNVMDSASAIVTTMLAENVPNPIYNVCSDFSHIAREQLLALYRIVPDAQSRVGIDPEDLDDAGKPDNGFNANRLKADFGWSSRYATIEAAFEDYVSWLKYNRY